MLEDRVLLVATRVATVVEAEEVLNGDATIKDLATDKEIERGAEASWPSSSRSSSSLVGVHFGDHQFFVDECIADGGFDLIVVGHRYVTKVNGAFEIGVCGVDEFS